MTDLTDAETQRWQNYIHDQIVKGLVAYHEDEQMRPVTRAVLKGLAAELRAEVRAEIAKALPDRQGELFYLDDAGNKQDAELHGPILRAVDYPIDEKIMGPIRSRRRAEYHAKRERAARVIDLPTTRCEVAMQDDDRVKRARRCRSRAPAASPTA